jgi:hypothetical protein
MSAGGRPERRGGRRWRLLGRSEPAGRSDRGAVLAEPVRAAEEPRCVRIRDCTSGPEGPLGRAVVRVSGTLRDVRERTVAGMPALRAELDDGTASLEVIWLGQRAIAGVETGRVLVASGRISITRGHPVLFNPRYELRPREQETP